MEQRVLPNVEVTLHAVDRFSQRGLDHWIEKGKGKGIMTFLVERSREAYFELLSKLDSSVIVDSCRINYHGMVYVYGTEFGRTKLITVYPSSEQ